MTGIQFVNIGEVLAGLKKQQETLENIPKAAKQMGVLAVNEIKPLCNVKTGNWRDTIHAEVHDLGKYKVELWVGSKGAFSGVSSVIAEAKEAKIFHGTLRKNVRKAQSSGAGSGYNYGVRQERLFHPIEIGWFRAQPAMMDLWNQIIHGQASRLVASPDEFSNMAGF